SRSAISGDPVSAPRARSLRRRKRALVDYVRYANRGSAQRRRPIRRAVAADPCDDPGVFMAPFSDRSIDHTLSVGPALVRAARDERAPCFAASLIEGPAVLLGLHQRATRVVDPAACRAAGVALHRRRTSGTAAFVE